MKVYFLGDGFEQWCAISNILGYESYLSSIVVEDESRNVLFIPEYIPISSIRSMAKKLKVVVVWRNHSTGVIENLNHEYNIVTDKNLLEKVNNSVYVPDHVSDLFTIFKDFDKDPSKIVDDVQLENKSPLEIARVLKDASVYTGTKYVNEAYAAGCEVKNLDKVSLVSKSFVAKRLDEVLTKLRLHP